MAGGQAKIGVAVMLCPFRETEISDMPGGKVPKFEMFIGFVSDNVAHPEDDDEDEFYEDILVNCSWLPCCSCKASS